MSGERLPAAIPGEAADLPDLDRLDRLAVRLLDDTDRPAREAALGLIRAALAAPGASDAPPRGTLLLLAALAAAQPWAIPAELGQDLAAALARHDLSRTHQPRLDELFALLDLLLPSEAARAIPGLLAAVLRAPELHPRWARRAGELLAALVEWWPDLVELDQGLALATALPAEPRARAFETIVAPLLLARPGQVNPEHLRRAQTAAADPSEARELLAALAAHPDTPPATREAARAMSAGDFPLRAVYDQLLGRRPLRVLCVQNIADAQGDELVRAVPLLQALLDAHPETRATLLTDRAYLYGHPRLTTISFDERQAIDAALAETPDVLIDCFEPTVRHLNYDPELEAELARLRAAGPPLLIQASKGWNRFLLDNVRLGGLDWARPLRLDRARFASVYQPALSLIAELGLPQRIGTMAPASGAVLAGHASRAADAFWRRLTEANTERRPVAVVNPFGGASALKGFTPPAYDDLAGMMTDLIDDGFFLILCPTGTPWGSRGAAEAVVARLPAGQQRYAAVAPDPAEAPSSMPLDDDPACRAPGAAVTMRRLIGLVARADLVVTVEGWMMHAAYLLGRPYRLWLLAGSAGHDWQPWGRDAEQRVRLFSGHTRAGEPPTPEQPRRRAWLALLARLEEPASLPILRLAARSPDPELRVAAAEALGRSGAPDRDELAALLDDPALPVRGRAAAALLALPESVPGVDRALLEVNACLGRRQADWAGVRAMGSRALPGLRRALHDGDPVVRRQAAALIERINREGGQVSTSAASATSAQPATTGSVAGGRSEPSVLILTPLKDAADCLPRYLELLESLSYPRERLSLGILESDSRDGSYGAIAAALPRLRRFFARAGLWQRDFGYAIPAGVHRGHPSVQRERRAVLARSRNHLLSHALEDEDWVLWHDVDLVDYPPDIVERLLAVGRDIVQPHCVLDYGGPTFDQNAWRDHGVLHLDDLRDEGELVRLDAVGGTMLLIRADLHRDGLIFPAVPYRPGHPLARGGDGELETEGLGLLAADMGQTCWGLPHLEIRHRRA